LGPSITTIACNLYGVATPSKGARKKVAGLSPFRQGAIYPATPNGEQENGVWNGHVRLQLHALAHDLGNFLRSLVTPEPIKDWSMTSLKEKLIKIGAKVVSDDRYVAFQMPDVAIPRNLFADILRLIAELRTPPVTSTV